MSLNREKIESGLVEKPVFFTAVFCQYPYLSTIIPFRFRRITMRQGGGSAGVYDNTLRKRIRHTPGVLCKACGFTGKESIHLIIAPPFGNALPFNSGSYSRSKEIPYFSNFLSSVGRETPNISQISPLFFLSFSLRIFLM